MDSTFMAAELSGGQIMKLSQIRHCSKTGCVSRGHGSPYWKTVAVAASFLPHVLADRSLESYMTFFCMHISSVYSNVNTASSVTDITVTANINYRIAEQLQSLSADKTVTFSLVGAAKMDISSSMCVLLRMTAHSQNASLCCGYDRLPTALSVCE